VKGVLSMILVIASRKGEAIQKQGWIASALRASQ